MSYSTEKLRTVALLGHGSAGKTTLAEALLARTGSIPVAGSVEKGTTVSDFDGLEKTFLHSLRTSVLHLDLPAHACPPARHAGISRTSSASRSARWMRSKPRRSSSMARAASR